MRILISSRNTLIPLGISKMLNDSKHQATFNEYHNLEQLIARLILEQSDMLIFDKTSEEELVIKELEEIRRRMPRLRLVLISPLEYPQFIQEAITMKVDGYLTYDCTDEEMNELLFEVQKGNQFYCQKVLSLLLPKIASASVAEEKSLTFRELEIARHIASGRTNKAIGELLCISPHTVHTHRKSMMKKLNISSAREVTLYILAVEGGIPL